MISDIKAILSYVKSFRLNSVFIRNFLIIMLIILIPITAVSTIFCVGIQNAANKEMSLVMQSNLSTVKNFVDTIIRTVELLAIQTSLNSNVESIFMSNYENSNVSKLYQNIREYIGYFTNVYPYIHSIYIYSERLNILIDNQNIMHISAFSDMGWYDTYKSVVADKTVIIPRKKGGSYPSFISIMRSVGITDVGKIGCVIVNLDVKKINESIYAMDDINLYNLVVVGKDNKVCLSRELKQVGENFSDYFSISPTGRLSDDGVSNVSIDGNKYLYSQLPSGKSGLSYMSFVPKTYFRSTVEGTISYMIAIVTLIFFLALFITMLISVKTYAPIRKILSILLPSYEVENTGNDDNNEIAYIVNSIKKSIDRNSELSEELNYRIILLNKAQLYALQMQINPHFLNNILETINWAAIRQLGSRNTVSEMIRGLSVLFEVSLDSEHFLIPVEEEMHHANVYIYLMSFNYGDDINYIWEIEEKISKFKMLKLTLQPILENAIYHGIKPKREKGEIRIKGEFYNDGILFSIHDNGVGMTKEELDALQNSLKGDVSRNMHIGIQNVDQRIKLVFGEKYGLTVESQKNVGTTVKIYIPKIDG